MFVGNISQYEKESRFLPEYIRPWIEKLSSLVKSDLQPGRHTFDTVNYMMPGSIIPMSPPIRSLL